MAAPSAAFPPLAGGAGDGDRDAVRRRAGIYRLGDIGAAQRKLVAAGARKRSEKQKNGNRSAPAAAPNTILMSTKGTRGSMHTAAVIATTCALYPPILGTPRLKWINKKQHSIPKKGEGGNFCLFYASWPTENAANKFAFRSTPQW